MLVVRCPHESSDGGCRDSIHRRDRGTSVIEELQMKSFKYQHHARHDRMRRCLCYAWLCQPPQCPISTILFFTVPKVKTEGTARMNPPEALCTFILSRIISTTIIILAARLYFYCTKRETANHHARASLESMMCTHSRLWLSVASPFLYIRYIVASFFFFIFQFVIHCIAFIIFIVRSFVRSFVRSSVGEGGRSFLFSLSLSLSPIFFLLSIILFVHSV